MITKEEAIKLAKDINNSYNYCTEYENAYLFSIKDFLSFGGFDSPVAVMKETGECFNMTHFVDCVDAGALVEEGYI